MAEIYYVRSGLGFLYRVFYPDPVHPEPKLRFTIKQFRRRIFYADDGIRDRIQVKKNEPGSEIFTHKTLDPDPTKIHRFPAVLCNIFVIYETSRIFLHDHDQFCGNGIPVARVYGYFSTWLDDKRILRMNDKNHRFRSILQMYIQKEEIQRKMYSI